MRCYNEIMKYKLIVSDFDGTLLRNDDKISQRTVTAIRSYINAGGIFTVSSGRNAVSVLQRLPDLGLDGLNLPVMALQGSYAVESVSKKELFSVTADRDLSIKFIRRCKEMGATVHVYSGNEIFTETANQWTDIYAKHTRTTVNAVGDLAEFTLKNEMRYNKVLGFFAGEVILDCDKKLRAEFEGEPVQIFTTSGYMIDFIDKDAGKGNGVIHVAKSLGIDLSETIAIGDEMNDMTMVRAAGLGVAMGNGREELKAVADFITSTNDNDGVAEIIEKFGLA